MTNRNIDITTWITFDWLVWMLMKIVTTLIVAQVITCDKVVYTHLTGIFNLTLSNNRDRTVQGVIIFSKQKLVKCYLLDTLY